MQVQAQTQASHVRSRLIAVDIVAHIILSFAIGLAVSVALAATVLLLSGPAQAQSATVPQAPPVQAMEPGEAQSGTLLFKSNARAFLER